MAASKYPHGFNLTFKVPAGDAVYNSLAVIAKSEWAPLGVNLAWTAVVPSASAWVWRRR